MFPPFYFEPVKCFTKTRQACNPTLHAMNPQSTPTSASSVIDDLFTLILVDGLPAESGGKQLRYRTVKLRETTVADERIAQRLAERVVLIGGVHKLLVSDADFQFGMTVQHIAGFECDGQTIPQAVIDWTLVGKLSPHDLGLIEQRVFLIAMASEVRYGNVTQAQFEQIMAGGTPPASGAASPQRGGQAADVGQVAAQSQSGPALLADFIGDAANGSPAGDER